MAGRALFPIVAKAGGLQNQGVDRVFLGDAASIAGNAGGCERKGNEVVCNGKIYWLNLIQH
jgi:hypothetical protein